MGSSRYGRRMRGRRAPRLAVIMLALAGVAAVGCSSVAGLDAAAEPRPCEEVYPAERCLRMADRATEGTPRTRDDVLAVRIVPDPPADPNVQTLGGPRPITVRVELRDGTTFDTQMCGGLSDDAACFDEPPEWLSTGSLISGGYHDVPCAGEPPDGCATPVPSIDPAIAPDATPIVVESLDIPVDRVGPYEVSLGTGALPNGILTEAVWRLLDPWPIGVTFGDRAPRLVVRSLEPDRTAFDNAYTHGWREGIERIEALIVFDVKRFDDGSVVQVRDVVVR
jgi:hypothetical protein